MMTVCRRSTRPLTINDTDHAQNVMAATYPELFAAATAYSGVPAGCFLSTANQADAWNSTGAQGNSHATEQQ